ncbi:MAG: UMP kinase [Rickettsiaceae bacterium]|nr:UMP kinase [Rickettsiaceae bacterium]
MMNQIKYKRVLLKLSGEALMGDKGFGLDVVTLQKISSDLRAIVNSGVQICVVVGGGNIYRGVKADQEGMERAAADYMGMLGTIINALGLQNVMERDGIHTRVQSAIPMMSICEPYIRRKAIRHMEKGRVVIFAAGTGNPFFTTDTAAVLRAIEMNCDLLIKGTQVDGVYNADPKTNPGARRYDTISYSDVLRDNLSVMDMAAIALARENKLPIKVFSLKNDHSISRVIKGEGSFTKIIEY